MNIISLIVTTIFLLCILVSFALGLLLYQNRKLRFELAVLQHTNRVFADKFRQIEKNKSAHAHALAFVDSCRFSNSEAQ